MTPRSPHRRFGALAIVVLLLLGGLCGCRRFPAETIRSDVLAVPAPYYNALFAGTGGGWSGGDGTLSIGLEGGISVWLFGDSFLGELSAGGGRSRNSPFIRNCIVIQDGRSLSTRFGMTDGGPSAFFAAERKDEWFWPGDGTVQGSELKIFLHRFREASDAPWGWEPAGNAMATLSLPALKIQGIRELDRKEGILFGVSLVEDDAVTYIYHTLDRAHPKAALLSKAPAGCLDCPWLHFTGNGWSGSGGQWTPLLTGVSTQYSVIRKGKFFYLFTMDGRTPLSPVMVVYRSAKPTGPWRGPVTLYTAPEADDKTAAYNPFVHTQFTTDGNDLIVSYNLNPIGDPEALYRNASSYRPRFIRVDFAGVEERFGEAEKARGARCEVRGKTDQNRFSRHWPGRASRNRSASGWPPALRVSQN